MYTEHSALNALALVAGLARPSCSSYSALVCLARTRTRIHSPYTTHLAHLTPRIPEINARTTPHHTPHNLTPQTWHNAPHTRVRARAAPAPSSSHQPPSSSHPSPNHLRTHRPNHLRIFAHLGMPTSTRRSLSDLRSPNSRSPEFEAFPFGTAPVPPCTRPSVPQASGLRRCGPSNPSHAYAPRARAAQSSPARAHAKRESRGARGESEQKVRAGLEALCPIRVLVRVSVSKCMSLSARMRVRAPGRVLVSPYLGGVL